MTPLLTLFTAPKPFTNPHIDTIQRNAISSWKQLGESVQVIVMGSDAGITEATAELGVKHIPNVRCNSSGTPLISSLFELARDASDTPLYMIINTDIILFPEILDSIKKTVSQTERFLMVGQRWDLDIRERLDYSGDWQRGLKTRLKVNGRLHPRGGSDYFIFPKNCYHTIPEFAIGRAGWDNWMIYEARRQGWKAIDATADIQIIHQDHDYSHLPNGQPHYRLPETYENVRLAGGPRTIFTLIDTDTVLENGQVKKMPWNAQKFWRELEIFPLVVLKSYTLAQIMYAILHPLRAYRDIRKWMQSNNKA
ncbi:MAG: hypothetical protein LWX83_09945 [Anaerolineae bacterium]|nr:hypothetical protein [Anaerolineae bacterium]